MTTIDHHIVLNAAYEAGLNEDNLYLGYSGRGMYGDKCFGITVDSIGEAMAFAVALATSDEDDNLDLTWLNRASTDSMGRSMIVYWPGVQVAEEAAA